MVRVLVKKFLQNETHLQSYLTSHRPFWKLSPYLDLMVIITMYYLIICSGINYTLSPKENKPLLYCPWQKRSWNHGVWNSGHSRQTALFNSIRRNWTLALRVEGKTEIQNKLLMDLHSLDLAETSSFLHTMTPTVGWYFNSYIKKKITSFVNASYL